MLVSVTMLGLLWAGVFILTRNLWVVVANHAAWNFTILLSGVPLSGTQRLAHTGAARNPLCGA